MKVMLDTNICTYLIKQQPPTILERFLAHPVGDIGISSITAAELAYGVSKSRHTTKNRHALEQFLPPPLRLSRLTRSQPGPMAVHESNLVKGTPIGSMDLLIAAHALTLGVRLVSNNLREFRRVPGLRLDNWL